MCFFLSLDRVATLSSRALHFRLVVLPTSPPQGATDLDELSILSLVGWPCIRFGRGKQHKRNNIWLLCPTIPGATLICSRHSLSCVCLRPLVPLAGTSPFVYTGSVSLESICLVARSPWGLISSPDPDAQSQLASVESQASPTHNKPAGSTTTSHRPSRFDAHAQHQIASTQLAVLAAAPPTHPHRAIARSLRQPSVALDVNIPASPADVTAHPQKQPAARPECGTSCSPIGCHL